MRTNFDLKPYNLYESRGVRARASIHVEYNKRKRTQTLSTLSDDGDGDDIPAQRISCEWK